MKDTILQIIGLIIIITPISITIWSFIRSKPYAKPMLLVSVISVFIGLPLIIINRITEITVGRVGTIKTATKQVTSDAKEVSKLKERIVSQGATIDLVAQNSIDAKNLSTEAKSLYEEISNKNILADKELKNISNKILPLELKAKSLSTLIRKMRKELLPLQEILKIQQMTTAAKAGSRKDYEELNKISTKDPRIQTYVKASLNDIFFYFDAEKNIKGRTLLETTTGKPIIYSVDEVIDIYYNADPVLNLPEAAINTLAILQRDTAVHDICDSIYKEQNLRVIARMIRALCILTDEYFETLDINKVKIWWENDTNKEKYKSYYKGLLEARALERRPSFGSNENDYKQVVSLLKQTTEADTNALYSKCLLGYYYTLLKDFVNAKKEFDEVEPLGNNNYHWFFFYKAVFILLQENPDIDAAIASLNREMEISPTVETIIKSSPVFKNLLENPQLKFPSNKK